MVGFGGAHPYREEVKDVCAYVPFGGLHQLGYTQCTVQRVSMRFG